MAEGADDDRPLGKVKRMDGCLKVYKKMPCSGKKEWCALGKSLNRKPQQIWTFVFLLTKIFSSVSDDLLTMACIHVQML